MNELVGFFGDDPPGSVEDGSSFSISTSSLLSAGALKDKRHHGTKRNRRRLSSAAAAPSLTKDPIPGRLRNSYSFSSISRHQTQEEIPSILPPEVEEGNIEYKRQLVNLTNNRFEHLVTQLKWRLAEGGGEALYELGVEDDGHLMGLGPEELQESVGTLQRMAEQLGAYTSTIRERRLKNNRKVVEILVRRVPDQPESVELRVAMLGNVDAGKSTLLGVLTQGQPDDGRGRARLNLFRHLHEVRSGRTSSVSREVIGFDANGCVVNYLEGRLLEEILRQSIKLMTLIDLAGHHKYQRTTLSGLSSYRPHCVLLVVSATTGMVGTSYDHCDLALALGVPLAIVITKVDLSPADRAMELVKEWLASPGVKRTPLLVENTEDAIHAASKLHTTRCTPIMPVSCVKWGGLSLLTTFLSQLSPPPDTAWHACTSTVEFWVDQVFKRIAEAEGPVLVGYLESGRIEEGQKLLLGPTEGGYFIHVRVLSLHRNRLPCQRVKFGQTASVAVTASGDDEKTSTIAEESAVFRRGMVLIQKEVRPVACLRLEARIALFGTERRHLREGFQVMLWCGNVCQTAAVERVYDRIPRCFVNEDSNDFCGENASVFDNRLPSEKCHKVIFRFTKHPEYVKEGRSLIFRNGRTKGHGEVIQVFPMESPG